MKKPQKLNTILASTTSALLITLSGSAIAADGAALFTSKGCVACHGADAKTPVMPNYPKVAGQHKEYLVEQMKDIKSGARSNGQAAAMKAIMAGVSEDEITALADYLSGL